MRSWRETWMDIVCYLLNQKASKWIVDFAPYTLIPGFGACAADFARGVGALWYSALYAAFTLLLPATVIICCNVKVEPQGTNDLPAVNRTLFLEKVRQSNAACQNGDFSTAVALYTDALQLDPTNHILFSNRSAARLKQGAFAQALQDAVTAKELCPTWPKAYYRQGVALQCLDRHGEALAAFSAGLAQDPTSTQLLSSLIEASIKSPLRASLEPTFQQLELMKLDQSPFVLISVVGQELLSAGLYQAAVTVLESALRVGSCSLKLRGSVFSALSSAHWALNQLDKAIGYMQQDLAIAKSLGDTAGECRAHGNLGSAFFSQGSYKEALTAHRYQLVLAMKCKDTQAAAIALTSLGHVYTAIGDYPNALASHKQCVQLVKRMGDHRLQEAREIGNVGAVYLAMGDFDSAVDCHTQHLRLAKRLGNRVEEARAYSNLGSSYHYRRSFAQAMGFHEKVLRLAQTIGDKSVEARAYAGLGHAARCAGDNAQAKHWHERQLDMALSTRDKVGEGRACSNLGIVYQLLGEYDAALKLHQAHLAIARNLQDRAGMGRAYGNIGNAYSAAGFYESAVKYHKQELTISKEVHDRSSEASTHGNLAVAYQAIGAHDMALLHYRAHLGIARELKDTAGEACALLNLGNCLSSRSEFGEAIPYYEQYLMLSQELADIEGEAKACHFLGYAHYCIGNYREAVRYYDQDLALAKDLHDKMNMGRAYCNLGLAHLALGQLDTALECQKYFLAIAHMTNNVAGKFRALGNIGDALIKTNQIEEAIKMYHRQLALARSNRDRAMEGTACGALGNAHRLLKRFDKALGYHTQELTLRQELGELSGECRAHGHLGSVHMSLGNYTHAVKCYQEQLERAQELQDCAVEAQAFGNLGIARLNMGHYEDAIGYLEQQLATLERLSCTSTTALDRGRAFGHLGDCYEALGDPEEAAKCHEQYLAAALRCKSDRDQERAYRGLGAAQKCLGRLQQALVCLEKRLVVAHEVGGADGKAAAYGELGQLHGALGNLEQAVSCMEHQRAIARELNDRILEAEALSGLGTIYQQMTEYTMALQYYQQDLDISEMLGMATLQARAYGNLGTVHECLNNLEQAIRYQEKHLAIAASANDQLAKTVALSALGRVHQILGNGQQAVGYLRQGLLIAETLGRRDEEARIRNRLGLALWANNDLDGAQKQLEITTQLLENIRRDCKNAPDYKLSLFELQTSSYQILQRVLVALNRQEEALAIAERGRNRAFVDLLLERQGVPSSDSTRNKRLKYSKMDDNSSNSSLTSVNQLQDIVNRQRALVIYYSIAAGYLHAWLIAPIKGVVKFHAVALHDNTSEEVNDDDHDGFQQQGCDPTALGTAVLDRLIATVRDSLGVDGNGGCNTIIEDTYSDDLLSTTPSATERGFLRMVNRQHLLNSSNYSLSSLFSVGSVGGSVASLRGSTRSSQGGGSGGGGGSVSGGSGRGRVAPLPWKGPSCLNVLYTLLLQPFEEYLTPNKSAATSRTQNDVMSTISNNMDSLDSNSNKRELILVLEGDLYLVPFPLLRGESMEYLCERFSILAAPNLNSLRSGRSTVHQVSRRQGNDINGPGASGKDQNVKSLIVGNPKLPASVTEHYGWRDMIQSEQEALMVAELLQTHALVGGDATKEQILTRIQDAECIHLATHVSWKLSSVVLSPAEVLEPSPNKKLYMSDSLEEEEPNDMLLGSSSADLPPLSEFLLSAADLLSLKLSARLVVISSSHTRDEQGWATSDGLVSLVRALLAAGAQSVLVSLWPVPETATKILLRAFYSSLLQGTKAARALSEAMQTVQHTKHFAHPANWAGFLLVGANVRLSNKVALMGQALCELLKAPDKCRDALRVSLHLVEKSLQRINRGQKNAMYTTQKSIENKVGTITGWKELLMSVGFRFEPASNGIPSSVFFPQSDPEERLTQCSASLQALLGLSPTSIQALSKLTGNAEVADDVIGVIQGALMQFTGAAASGGSGGGDCAASTADGGGSSGGGSLVGGGSVDVPLNVRLWRVPGCHELLASLGFDLCDVGQDRITLRTGKQANKRNIQFTLQALLALFDTQEAPKTLDTSSSSSSLESLASNDYSNSATHSDNDLPTITTSKAASAVPPPIVKSLIPRVPPPFTRSTVLPAAVGGSGGGAFTSYVKRRGEPDGRTANPTSDGKQQGALLKRPGGGESDAAFTPSPPVVLDGAAGQQLTLSLAHQTIIRNLYSQQSPRNSTKTDKHRPDSSSSASSATDWENGQNTVLRRQHASNAIRHTSSQVPPIPPPRTSKNILDLTPLYNNLPGGQLVGSSSSQHHHLGGLFENSSDSEFEKMESKLFGNNVQMQQQLSGRSRVTYKKCRMSTLDRLSVRTELSTSSIPITSNTTRKIIPLNIPDEPANNERLLYFHPNDSSKLSIKEDDKLNKLLSSAVTTEQSSTSKLLSATDQNVNNATSNATTLHDTILATQLRHINRELTPTISEVYHERNIGLGLAPPLSKLLLNQGVENNFLEKISLGLLDDSIGISDAGNVGPQQTQQQCLRCKVEGGLCGCQGGVGNGGNKPWLNDSDTCSGRLQLQPIQSSDLTTAEKLKREQVKHNKKTMSRSESKQRHKDDQMTIADIMARRDEGDGRSIADSNSSSYKATQFWTNFRGDNGKIENRLVNTTSRTSRKTKS